MRNISNFGITNDPDYQGHYGHPYNVTIATVDVDGIRRQVMLNWIDNTLTVSPENPRDSGSKAQVFPMPDIDIEKFLEDNLL